MEQNRANDRARAIQWVLFAAAIAVLSWTIACGQNSPTDPTSPVATPQPGAAAVTGMTSAVSFNTAPPPEDPGAPVIIGNLLAYDQECPACTLVTPRGTALVWFNTLLFARTQEGTMPITVEQLNAALQPGQPLKITVDGLENTQPVAQTLILERKFSAAGTVDRSSMDVAGTGEFVLTVVDAVAGVVKITYLLAETAMIEPFEAETRVLVSGVVNNGKLRAQLVQPDE